MLSSLVFVIAMKTVRRTTVTATRLFSRLSSRWAASAASRLADSAVSVALIGHPRAGLSRGCECTSGGRAESREIELAHIVEQPHKCAGAVVERGLAFGGGRKRGIAHGAGGMQILRHPAKADRYIGAQPSEV